jgi:predicted ATPase
MLWPSVVSKHELARADVKAMIKVLRLRAEMKMVKETKFFRKQAEKAERMALATSDEEASQSLSNLAQAYRSQADALKKSKKLKKSMKMSGKKGG